jgi:phosphoglycerol transferase MdoB-like AlkP superfamily enzyme
MSKNSSSSGTSIAGLLGIAFVVLKLTNVIDWSWWWVTLPFWGGLVILLLVLLSWLVIKLIGNIEIKKPEVKETKTKSKFQQRLEEVAKERKN